MVSARDRPAVKRRLRGAWAKDDHRQALGELEAERQFRRIVGHSDLAKLALAIEREVTQPTITHPSEKAATLVTVREIHPGRRQNPRRPGHPQDHGHTMARIKTAKPPMKPN